MAKKGTLVPVPAELIERHIYIVRGHRAMVDEDLAALYVLNK